MFILSPLRHRPMRLLWSGQVASAIGDEVYKVALVWLAIRLIGKDAGFIAAVEAGSILLFGILGGVWAEAWDHRRTMVAVDLIRAVCLFLIPVVAFFVPLTLPMLIPIAIIVSALSAFFDPALQASLPEIAKDEDLLTASNGLMEATRRLARVIGPGLIGLAHGFLPLIHFFTVDAFTFLLSALSVWALRRDLPGLPATDPAASPIKAWESLKLGFVQLAEHPLIRFMVLGSVVTWSIWSLCFALGFALLVNERAPADMGAYGLLICAYGVGNLLSNIFWGNRRIERPSLTLFTGTAILGIGFLCVALAPTLPWMMLAASLCAIGGPMEDLSFLAIAQARYRGAAIARLFRLRMALGYGGTFVVLLVCPFLFRKFSVAGVTGIAGALLFLFGLVGLASFGRELPMLKGQRVTA